MSTTEETKKKGKGWKKVLFLFGIIEIGGMITALVFIIIALTGSETSTDLLWTGFYILWGVGGSFPIIFVPLMFTIFIRRRNTLFSTVQSFKLSQIGPYAPGYKPSGVKNPRFCEYCGYEVLAGERECTECGGPIKNIKRSYIT